MFKNDSKNPIIMKIKRIIVISIVLTLLCFTTYAQRDRDQRIPLIGSQAPAFKSSSTSGPVSFPQDFGKRLENTFCPPARFYACLLI